MRMLLSELLDIDKLREEVWRRMVSVRSHPLDLDLRIFNYTHEAAYEGQWTHEQKVCRGLIVRTSTETVGRRSGRSALPEVLQLGRAHPQPRGDPAR